MADQTGQQLGNYQLIQQLGQGGFADVYLGRHVYLNTHAAIKILRSRLVGSTLNDFRTEAQAIARLIHPNIVRVLEFGVENNVAFLIMDYAPNGSLRYRHARGTLLSPKDTVPYVKQIAAGLQYAHDSGLIHRDVKPENMLVGLNNDILLSDFGLVLPAQSSGSLTTKEMAGTVPYMAPEQIKGKPRPASDQYALGVVIYEWLSGDRPFQGSAFEIYGQHLHTPPPSLREKLPSLSLMIEQVVLTALAKEPQQRFHSIESFATAFERACGQAPQPAQTVPSGWLPPGPSLESTLIKTPPDQSSQLGLLSLTSDLPTDALTSVRQIQQHPMPNLTPNQPSLLEIARTSPVRSTPTYGVQSTQPPLPARRISRRGLLVGLTGLVALGVVAGSTALLVHSFTPSTFSIPAIPGSSPTSGVSPVSRNSTADPTSDLTTNPVSNPTHSSIPDPTADPTLDPTADPTTNGGNHNMTSISGAWQIDANGSQGTLTIGTVDNQGSFSGSITFIDATRNDSIQGTWNDSAGQITFVRYLAGGTVTQNFTGYLGNNHPEQFIILGGSFTQSNVAANAQRTNFGWFAQK
jgi:serine/threonine protein kinase